MQFLCVFFLNFFFILAGGGRYIPGSDPTPTAPVGVADPFTGVLLATGSTGTTASLGEKNKLSMSQGLSNNDRRVIRKMT